MASGVFWATIGSRSCWPGLVRAVPADRAARWYCVRRNYTCRSSVTVSGLVFTDFVLAARWRRAQLASLAAFQGFSARGGRGAVMSRSGRGAGWVQSHLVVVPHSHER